MKNNASKLLTFGIVAASLMAPAVSSAFDRDHHGHYDRGWHRGYRPVTYYRVRHESLWHRSYPRYIYPSYYSPDAECFYRGGVLYEPHYYHRRSGISLVFVARF